jgi:hypothetical protein
MRILVSARILLVDVPHPNTYYIAPGRDFILNQTSDGDSASDRLHQPYECATRPDITEYYPQSYTKYHNQLPFVPDRELGLNLHSSDLEDGSSTTIVKPGLKPHSSGSDDLNSCVPVEGMGSKLHSANSDTDSGEPVNDPASQPYSNDSDNSDPGVPIKEPELKSHSDDLDDDSSTLVKEPASNLHSEDFDDRSSSSYMTALEHIENTSNDEAAHPEVSLFYAHRNILFIKFQKQTLPAVNVQIADSSRRTEPAPPVDLPPRLGQHPDRHSTKVLPGPDTSTSAPSNPVLVLSSSTNPASYLSQPQNEVCAVVRMSLGAKLRLN